MKTRPISMVPGKGFRVLASSAMLSTFALITIGAVVRVTGSGLGCPDWVLCHGKLVPPIEFHALIEYSHRIAAFLVSILVVALGFVTWLRYRAIKDIVVPATLAVVFLFIQVVLGGITVLKELPPSIVTVHLAVSQVIIALLLAILVRAWGVPVVWTHGITEQGLQRNTRLFKWILMATGGTFLVTLSGSYMVGANAAFACVSWPLCGDGFIPNDELAWIHMAHRLVAVIMGGVIIWASVLGWRERTHAPLIGSIGLLAMILLVSQVLVGAANLWTGFMSEARVVHLALATALWGTLVVLTLLVYQGVSHKGLKNVIGEEDSDGGGLA